MVGQPWPAANGRQRFKAASTSRQDDDAKRLSTIRSTGLTRVAPSKKSISLRVAREPYVP